MALFIMALMCITHFICPADLQSEVPSSPPVAIERKESKTHVAEKAHVAQMLKYTQMLQLQEQNKAHSQPEACDQERVDSKKDPVLRLQDKQLSPKNRTSSVCLKSDSSSDDEIFHLEMD